MATILEALQNANYNMQNAVMQLQVEIAKEQLNNAVSLLEKGYSIDDEVEETISEFGSLSEVPDK